MKYKDWDKEYELGTHWEDKPSKYMGHFEKYLSTGDLILDAGCGTGRDCQYLSDKGYRLIGTDLSESAIKKAKERNLPCDFRIESIENNSFSDDSFDKIYCGHVLHSTDLEKAVSELHRILKPDGTLFVVMYESTIYEDGSEQHPSRSHEGITSLFEKYFKVLDEQVTVSDDEDRFGKHRHVRLVIVLRK